jgi:hypothetical protein
MTTTLVGKTPAAESCALKEERNCRPGNVVRPIVATGFPQGILAAVENLACREKSFVAKAPENNSQQ